MTLRNNQLERSPRENQSHTSGGKQSLRCNEYIGKLYRMIEKNHEIHMKSCINSKIFEQIFVNIGKIDS